MARILVVDDERDILGAMAGFLKADGHDVSTAVDAESALDGLTAGVDVVVTDIVLPGRSGVELLESIRAASPGVQVVMITGDPTVETAAAALRAGAADYLVKPFKRQDLCDSVTKAARIKALDDDRLRLLAENRRYQQDLEQLVQAQTNDLRETNERLEATLMATIQAMSRAVESRDPYTAGHQQRVAELGRAIGAELGLPAENIKAVDLAGQIHDLGKIRVPAEILTKPGILTDAEYQIIQAHAQTAYDILEPIRFPWPLADIVLQHHEKLDGSGYPRGISGENILMEARILGVADTVEAMAAHRPYRPALGIERALSEIEEKRGMLFDAGVVDACLTLFRQRGFRFGQ